MNYIYINIYIHYSKYVIQCFDMTFCHGRCTENQGAPAPIHMGIIVDTPVPLVVWCSL